MLRLLGKLEPAALKEATFCDFLISTHNFRFLVFRKAGSLLSLFPNLT